MAGGDKSDHRQFIVENTRILSPPLVPEIRLHLAEESLPIWQKTEEELCEINVPPPFWAFAWAGGQALARYLLDHTNLVKGQRVLDIGAGSGLIAIAAAKAGASHVVANDIDTFAVCACALNAALNNVVVAVSSDNLISPPHETIKNFPSAGHAPFNIVCLGDVFYEADLARDVMAFARSMQRGGARVFVGDPRRSYFPSAQLIERATYKVPVTRELEDNEIKNASVWELELP